MLNWILLSVTVACSLVGFLLGVAIASRILGKRALARRTQLVAAARQHVVAATQNLRTANARLQAELEKERAARKIQQSTLAGKKRGDVARLEGELRFGDVRIDRLSAAATGRSNKPDDEQTDADGFALTRPYEGF